jgi:hypothetical protein
MLTRSRCLVVLFALALASPSAVHAGLGKFANAPLLREGAVVIRTEPNLVLIGVAPVGGGTVEDLFVFWPGQELKPGIQRFAVAEVRYDAIGTVRIIVPTEQVSVTYAVHGVVRPKELHPEGFASSTFEGVGLNHTIGELAARFSVGARTRRPGEVIQKSSYATCTLDGTCESGTFSLFLDAGDDTGGTKKPDCKNGGVGSTACSYSKDGKIGPISGGTSCSTTCEAGYYACCYEDCPLGSFGTCTPTCRCIKE